MSRTRNNIIVINAENIHQHPWLFSYFRDEKAKGIQSWSGIKAYQFSDITFKLSDGLLILARPKKKAPLKSAYELIDMHSHLGYGSYGSVYSIIKTVSRADNGDYRVRNKNRVVKFQAIQDSLYESQMARKAPQLHAKAPNAGGMVMRKQPGVTLNKLLRQNIFSRQETLDLLMAIVKAVKEQLVDVKIRHNDLHCSNVMVTMDKSSGHAVFGVNIID